jgi:2-methylisocitrate lyase-like PEP mutase family enzyme
VSPASVFDPLSSRIAEELGFEVAMLAGSVASLVVLGAPDMILLSATEFAEQAYRIGRARFAAADRRCRSRLRQCAQRHENRVGA